MFYIYCEYLINQKSASLLRLCALANLLFYCCCEIIVLKTLLYLISVECIYCKCRDKSNPMLLYCKFKGHYVPPCAPPLLVP